jgi:hypothetical protein
MKKRLSYRDAEAIMYMIGTMALLDLIAMEDVFDIMVDVQDFVDLSDSHHIDYLSAIINSINTP